MSKKQQSKTLTGQRQNPAPSSPCLQLETVKLLCFFCTFPTKLNIFYRERFGHSKLNIFVRAKKKLIRDWNVSDALFLNFLPNNLCHIFGHIACGIDCFVNSHSPNQK